MNRSSFRERDTETNYDYFGARYYDSRIARWLQVDPLEGEDLGWSPYNYVRNNPINKIDPDGKFWDTIIDAVSVGYSAYEFIKDPSWENAGYLAADVGGALVPFVPATGSIRLGAKVLGHTDEVVDGAKAVDKSNDAKKTYQTYTKTNPQTGEVYTGRTSGNKTPRENVANRDKNHHMNKNGFGPAKLDKSSTNKDAIRGREQQLIQQNGGAKSNGGKSGNQINGVSDKNKNKKRYKDEAKKEFGQ